jgi:hypothetical protein
MHTLYLYKCFWANCKIEEVSTGICLSMVLSTTEKNNDLCVPRLGITEKKHGHLICCRKTIYIDVLIFLRKVVKVNHT